MGLMLLNMQVKTQFNKNFFEGRLEGDLNI